MRIRYRGVITVEAAMVFPIIVFLIVALIIYGMMLCDICRMESMTDGVLEDIESVVFRDYDISTCRINYKNQGDSKLIRDVTNMAAGAYKDEIRETEDFLKEQLEEVMLVYEIKDLIVDIKFGRVYVTLTANNRLGRFPFINVLKDEMKMEKSRLLTDECDVIRMTECIKDK